jgi:hypothetical protein
MARKKSWAAASVFLLCLALPAADWQKEAAGRMLKEGEYPLLVESLQKIYADLNEKEKPAAAMVIGYCHYRLQDPQAELFWMNRYLQELKGAKVALAFLAPVVRQKVLAFVRSWQEEFPVLRELALAAEQAEVAFFEPPAELKLRLQVSLPCDYQLLASDGALLSKGTLGRDTATLVLKVADDFFRSPSHHFRLLLTLRSAPERTLEKYFGIELQYVVPANALFDAASGNVTLVGRELRPESETQTRIVSQRTLFDKAYFKRSVLKDLLVGAAFFVTGATLVGSAVDNPDTSLFARSALFGTRRAFNLAGIGFSLSALVKLPKTFKRERVVEEQTRDLPEARAANEALKRDLALARQGIRVQLAVKAI